MTSEEKTMSIKAFYYKADGNVEIRRFGLPETLATMFSALKEKVRNVFNLGSAEFDIMWQDWEGDDITISSDGELAEAIAESLKGDGPQLLKINVIPKSKPTSTDNDTSGAEKEKQEHFGVVCDGCDGKIIGFRYKCLICPDYDLCSPCEGKNMHSHHQMIRITSPNENPGNFFTNMNFGTAHAFSAGGGCGRGRRHAGWWQGPRCGRDFGRRGRGPRHHKDFSGRPFTSNLFGNMEGRESEFAADLIKGIWTAFTGQNPAGEKNNTGSAEASTSKQGEQAAASSNTESESKSDEKKDTTTESEMKNKSASEVYLQNVGENVAKMLDPLGIDVQISVENNGVRQRCSVNKEKEPKTPEKKPAEEEEMQTDDEHYYKDLSEKLKEFEMEEEKSPESAKNEDEEWMLINEDKSQSSSPRAEDPKSENTKSSESHPDPKIQRALELLGQMGYKNEGGWLTNILVMKNGDINQVLDLLHPLTK